MWLEFVSRLSAKRAERSQWELTVGHVVFGFKGWSKAAPLMQVFPKKNKNTTSKSHQPVPWIHLWIPCVATKVRGKKTHLFTVLYLAQPGSVCRLQRCSLNRQLWFESRLMQSQAGVGCSCAQSCLCSLGTEEGIVHFLRAQQQERWKASTSPVSECVPEFRGQKVLLGDWQQLCATELLRCPWARYQTLKHAWLHVHVFFACYNMQKQWFFLWNS